MKTIIKIDFSENSKTVLADTKIEVEVDGKVLEFEDVLEASKKLFIEAQKFALMQSMKRNM